MTIEIINGQTGQHYTVSDATALQTAISNGDMPIRPDGSPYTITNSGGLFYLDGQAVSGGGVTVPGTVYRLILKVPAGYATGATYPGCSRYNADACDPKLFTTMAQAIDYAHSRNEIPYQVYSEDESWAIVTGSLHPDPNRPLSDPADVPVSNPVGGTLAGVSTPTLVLGGLALFFLAKKLL